MGVTRDTLKEGTKEAHRRLDDTALVDGLAKGSLTRGEYSNLLGIYHQFFAAFEQAMTRDYPHIVDALGNFRFHKTYWLAEDLAKLGAPPLTGTTRSFEIPHHPAAIAGCLYVVEGSTLGGMHLAKSGKGFPENAGRFYEGYGEETLPAWKSFIAWLEEAVIDPSDRETALHAAEKTFEWFESEFHQHAQA